MQDPPDINEVLKKLESNLPFCRVCLNLSMEYIEFDSTLCMVDGADITYSDAFQLVTPSQVDQSDRLPKTICSSCGNDLVNAFLFRKRVENADIILNKIYFEESLNDYESLDIKIESKHNGLDDEPLLIQENSLQVDIYPGDLKLNGDGYTTFVDSNRSRSSSSTSLFTDSDLESAKEESNAFNDLNESCVYMCKDFREVKSSGGSLHSHNKHQQISNNGDESLIDKLDKSVKVFEGLENGMCFEILSEVTSDDSDKLCYRCKLCERKYKSESDFTDHINIHKDKRPYKCRSCKEQFHTKHFLRIHTFRFHKKIQKKTVNRGKSSIEKKEKCSVCFKMVRKSFMEIHKEVHFGPRSSMCTECGKQFGSRLALRTHSLIHKQSGQFLCHICNKICQTMYALKSHIQFKHIVDKSLLGKKKYKYQCEDCGLIFQYPSKLRVHQRKHNAEAPYVCPHCSRSYLRKDQFNIHMRYHNNDLPYKCEQCDKSYATKNNLSEHRKSVHDNVTYSCDKCEQKFKSVTGLRKHKFVHTGYPYVCPICGLGQPFRSGIKAHLLRVHKDTFTEEEFNEAFPVVIPKSGFRRPKI